MDTRKVGHALLLKIKHAIDTYSSRYVIIRSMSINNPDGDEFTNADVLSMSGKENNAFGKMQASVYIGRTERGDGGTYRAKEREREKHVEQKSERPRQREGERQREREREGEGGERERERERARERERERER